MEECVQELLACRNVGRIHADQCQYNLEVMHGRDKGAPLKKPTGFMSNGPKIPKALSQVCTGRNGICSRRAGGRHGLCSGKVAKEAARYTPTLYKAMLRGVSEELKARGIIKDGEIGLHAVCDEDDPQTLRGPEQGFTGKYVDDMSGQILNDSLVNEARQKELEYFTSKGVWRKRLLSEAFATTGRRPISVR